MNVWQYPRSWHGSTETRFTASSSERTGSPHAYAYLPLLAAAIQRGQRAVFEIHGRCMWPAIKPGDRIHVGPLWREPRVGDVLICYSGTHAAVHRVVACQRDPSGQSWVRCRGDATLWPDAALSVSQVLGRVERLERAGRVVPLRDTAAISSRLAAPLRAAWGYVQAKLAARASRVGSEIS
jgi:hypothetical protein